MKTLYPNQYALFHNFVDAFINKIPFEDANIEIDTDIIETAFSMGSLVEFIIVFAKSIDIDRVRTHDEIINEARGFAKMFQNLHMWITNIMYHETLTTVDSTITSELNEAMTDHTSYLSNQDSLITYMAVNDHKQTFEEHICHLNEKIMKLITKLGNTEIDPENTEITEQTVIENLIYSILPLTPFL
jgi:hypothetical protein